MSPPPGVPPTSPGPDGKEISFGYVTRNVVPELLDYHAGLLCHGGRAPCSNQGTGG